MEKSILGILKTKQTNQQQQQQQQKKKLHSAPRKKLKLICGFHWHVSKQISTELLF